MRFPRVKADGQGFYHCVSRVVDRRFIFHTSGHGSAEAERFIQLMRRLEAFSGIHVLTYVLMSNHFHLLCEVPEPKALAETEVLQRIEAGFGLAHRQALQQQLDRYRQQPDGSAQIQRLLDRYRRRMYDLSVFIKELKGRFAQGYNQRHERSGVLWSERFKSVLVQGGEALAAVAAYIELNPSGPVCVLTPRTIVTAVTPRLWPKVVRWLTKVSAPFSACPKRPPGASSAASIAHTCLSKAALTAQTERRPLTWTVPNVSLNSKWANLLYPNACFVGSGISVTG
jgi:REP element-mobilizing transposase RayT